MKEVKRQIAVGILPWVGLREDIQIGPITFWPWNPDRIEDQEVKDQLNRFFQVFIDSYGKPVDTIAICSCGSPDFHIFEKDEYQSLLSAINVLTFASICPEVKRSVCSNNNSMAPPIWSLMEQVYPNNAVKKNINQGSQIWAFSHRMKIGDWIALPSKMKSAIHFGKVTGGYHFDPKAENPLYHYRTIDWFATDIPRSNFDQDILYSLGAFMTVCQVKRNDAEQRIKNMAENDWKPSPPKRPKIQKAPTGDPGEPGEGFSDLEELSSDQIAKLIIAKFQGHGMAALVNGILKAQGYTTFVSPEGPDKGVDILAGQGPMGFGEPRLCVQVKSGSSPLDRPTLDQLIGTMQNVQATQGLLISWGGFKSSIDKEESAQFFKVRLWDQKDLIEQLLKQYDKLDEDIRADLPLKRIWTIANPETETDE